MIPAGYMAKNVMLKPGWLKADQVTDIYSVSVCMSSNFLDYTDYWKHNSFWFFDSPEVIVQLAADNEIDLTECKLFYYEIYELEFNSDRKKWLSFVPNIELKAEVIQPQTAKLEGYDIVTCPMRVEPECSPLSCNGLAATIATNCHCLLKSLEEAKRLLENGFFNNSEPGPYRIFSVYSIDWPS
jgi:hypothetical protein